MLCVYMIVGSGCGTFDITVASNTRGPGSNTLIGNIYLLLNVCGKDKNSVKWIKFRFDSVLDACKKDKRKNVPICGSSLNSRVANIGKIKVPILSQFGSEPKNIIFSVKFRYFHFKHFDWRLKNIQPIKAL